MNTRIPLSTVCIGELERRYVLEALETGMISSTGSHVRRFEERIASTVQRTFAIATNSGSSALELVLRAMGIGPGDEVIIPALTFASPALATVLTGATPVFADVSEETWTLDVDDVREAITPRTRAIIAVDVLGHPCDYDELLALGVPLIEDAAEAHGAKYKTRPAGSFGVASIFSFHANKTVTSGEGGCVLTDDSDLAAQVRKINAFGMDANLRYWHTAVGSNYRMANLVAAVALAQVERWSELVAGRNRVGQQYDYALQNASVKRRPVASWAGEAIWLYTIQSGQRDGILAACEQDMIDARGIWPSLPENPVFASFADRSCPVAKRISQQALWLPTWSDMPDLDIQRVSETISKAMGGA